MYKSLYTRILCAYVDIYMITSTMCRLNNIKIILYLSFRAIQVHNI